MQHATTRLLPLQCQNPACVLEGACVHWLATWWIVGGMQHRNKQGCDKLQSRWNTCQNSGVEGEAGRMLYATGNPADGRQRNLHTRDN